MELLGKSMKKILKESLNELLERSLEERQEKSWIGILGEISERASGGISEVWTNP